MKNLCELSLLKAIDLVKKGRADPKDFWQSCLQKHQEKDPKIHAFLTLNQKGMEKLAQKSLRGKTLAGLPFAVKDNFSVRGLRATAGSKILADYVPPYTATVVSRLQKAGGVVFGKTNCDAFAFGASGENSGFGPTCNPYDLTRVPGGSSSGSAAAVASNQAIFALGSDTGGSIRQPAAFCGVVGLKPTYGRCSRWGLMAMGSSFDTPGPITKTVADAALVLSIMAGNDKHDATSAKQPAADYRRDLKEGVKGMKIGLVKEFFRSELQSEIVAAVKKAAQELEKAGAHLVNISLPHIDEALAVYYVLVPAEISSNMARYDGVRFGYQSKRGQTALETSAYSRGESFELEVKRRILIGSYILSAGYFDAYYLQASRVRTLITNEFRQLFNKVDLILGPTTPTTAFKLGEKIANPVEMYLSDIFTVPANVAGLPAISLPFGKDKNGLPIGIQLIGNYFKEGQILQAAYWLEGIYGN